MTMPLAVLMSDVGVPPVEPEEGIIADVVEGVMIAMLAGLRMEVAMIKRVAIEDAEEVGEEDLGGKASVIIILIIRKRA